MQKKEITEEYLHRFGNGSIDRVVARILVAMDYKQPEKYFANALGISEDTPYLRARAAQISTAIDIVSAVKRVDCSFLKIMLGKDPKEYYHSQKGRLRPEDAYLLERGIDKMDYVLRDICYGLIKRK